ncbi:MAG: hypothetical protein WCJ26_01800 [bacterium]
MKTTIKLFAASAIIFCFTANLEAQNNQSANANLTASANVAAAVTVAKTTDLAFGNVTPNNVKTINTEGTVVSPGITTGGEVVGKFALTKSASTQVTLAFSLPTNLVDGSSHNLAISFADYSSSKLAKITNGGASPDIAFTPASGITTANTSTTAWAFAATGFDVNIGGTVSPIAGQVAGTYTNTVTLTATYN